MFTDNTFYQPCEQGGCRLTNPVKSAIGQGLSVSYADFVNRPGCIYLSLANDADRQQLKNADSDLVFRVFADGESYYLDSANYIGQINWPIAGKPLSFEIGSRFSATFLQRMLNFANDVVLDDIDADKVSKSPQSTTEFILFYLFSQSLEKAFILGLPKRYQSQQHHEARLKGVLDINRTLKQDWPFKGKISSTSREQWPVVEIADVLYKAVTVIGKKQSGLMDRIKHVLPAIREAKSNQFVSPSVVLKAKQSSSLNNPIFYPYRQVLNYAEMILKLEGIVSSKNADQSGVSFILNIAELFEIYVRKLLALHFQDWSVDSPKIKLYENQFYSRHIIPDIVMRKGNKVAVFDTKYKRMNYVGRHQNGMGDVDRADLFQIHTYMSYYQSQPDIEFIGGGLLYPLSQAYSESNCFSSKLLENHQSWFLVDGIEIPLELCAQANITDKKSKTHNQDELPKTQLMQTLISAEQAFINRMKKRLEV
jgi:5-methylcytosine-specific restriction endonuclease McrBC regulatory subunit McrC